MAPRTRSNRAELLVREQLLASGLSFNTKGFPTLPDELYLEIISNFPPIPVPTENIRLDTRALRNRQKTLFSLSQTCQSLRRVFLRYLWQRIEVYDGMETTKGVLPPLNTVWVKPRFKNHVYKQYAEELVRQLEIVTIRDPNLAQYVNILNVLIVNYSVETVLPELARCIALFPNLYTVQMHFRSLSNRFDVKEIFKAYQFSQIRNVCVSAESAHFLISCPGAHRVSQYPTRHSHSSSSYILDKIVKYCPQVQTLGFFSALTLNHVVHLKNLCDITLDPFILMNYDHVKFFSQLSRLHAIRIKRAIQEGATPTSKEFVQSIDNARKILLECPKNGTDEKKRVVLYHNNGKVETFPVLTD